MICLEEFEESTNERGKVFLKTHCFHYFHASCLALWIKQEEEKIAKNAEHEQQIRILYPNRIIEHHSPQCPQCRQYLTEEDRKLVESLIK